MTLTENSSKESTPNSPNQSRHTALGPAPTPSFPRRRAVHRDENDEEQRSSALQAHTLAQRDRRLVNPQGRGMTQ